MLGKTDRTRLGDALQPRGDINSVAHEVAVALLDHVAEMKADAKFDAAVGRQSRVALDKAGLHLDRAAHRVDHAPEFDDAAVAGALDDAAVMSGDRRIDEVAAEPTKSRERPLLIRADKPGVSDDVGHQDRRKFPGLAHCALPLPEIWDKLRPTGPQFDRVLVR